jgi:signal transduction histidine kinase
MGIVDGWTVVQVDDDGPGFGAGAPGVSSLGLGIAQDLADAAGGDLEICRGALGGCCVRLRLPAAASQPQPGVVGA